MNSFALFQPMAAMFVLTAIVWAFMFARRMSYITTHKIDPQTIATPEALNARIPGPINNASNNLKNLFELPVIFYALCLAISMTGATDNTYTTLAWIFFIGRCAHSAVHCTFNNVNLRFIGYLVASVVLWIMVARFALQVFGAN